MRSLRAAFASASNWAMIALVSSSSPSMGRIQSIARLVSTRTRRTRRVSGIARIAPIGPITTAQNSTEKNVIVWLRLTAFPTTRGWITDWMMPLMTP